MAKAVPRITPVDNVKRIMHHEIKPRECYKRGKHYCSCTDFLWYNIRDTAPSNDARVCPDGNEKSFSLGISNMMDGSKSYGLTLAMSGFRSKIAEHKSEDKRYSHSYSRAARLFEKRRSSASIIQNMPEFARRVIIGMIVSRNVHCKASCRLCRIPISKEFSVFIFLPLCLLR